MAILSHLLHVKRSVYQTIIVLFCTWGITNQFNVIHVGYKQFLAVIYVHALIQNISLLLSYSGKSCIQMIKF